jgi:hypothetical protein
MDWLERHSCWRLGHRDDWSRAPPHRAIRDCLGPQKRDRSPSRGAGGELSHRRDRAGEPCCQGPGPRQQKHQWVPTLGPRVLANQGVALLMLIPSQTCAVRGGFIPKPASSHTPKPLPLEMAPATHLFVSPDRVVLDSPFLATAGPSHHAAPPITLPAKDTFNMHSLLHAIPDPMLVEATLPPPLSSNPLPCRPHNNSCPNAFPTLVLCWYDPLSATHRAPPATVNPDEELWLPNDPFHGFDGPSVFGPKIDWDTELPSTIITLAISSRSPSPIDSKAEFTHLPPGLLDSPMPPCPSRRTQYLSLPCPTLLLTGQPQMRIL